ncbi:MAG: permease [Candidatus Omnitrophica bacterium]|nr:permease [Candidatus Omnitrophota bacterium]
MAKDPICGMDVKESSAFQLEKEGKRFFFCSQHCLDKFAQEHGIEDKDVTCCVIRPKQPWFFNKVFIAAAVIAGLGALSYFMPSLVPFRNSFAMYFQRIWWAILLGLVLGGVIDYLVPREYISHILASPKKKTIFYSVILGFFMSACSHGILALSIELHKKGASNPAVIAFLLASPWANFPLTIMLVGFFGLKAFYIIICALIIAITTGFIFQLLESRGLIETNKNTLKLKEGFSVIKDIRQRFRKGDTFPIGVESVSRLGWKTFLKGIFSGSISLANMVLWWILIGMGLASLAAAYIPQDIFQNYMGPTALGLIVTLIVATIMEVCSEGTAPLAFEIFRQTGALGNSFVFLMAGVVTDYTEIGLLWHNVGKRVAVWLPIITVPQVVLLGILANIIF